MVKRLVRGEIILDNVTIDQRYTVGINGYCLVVDTETHTDIGQKAKIAMFSCFHLEEASKKPENINYIKKGIVVYDLSDKELSVLKLYCKEHDLSLLSKENFINQVLFPTLEKGTLLVGHNIPFDIGALCTDFSIIEDTKKFRFKLCHCNETPDSIHYHTDITNPCDIHPTIIIEQIKSKKYIMYVESNNYGSIIDTMVVGNALLGAGKAGLDAMIKRYGYTDSGKKEIESYSTEYDTTFYEYSMHDVYLTSMLVSSQYQLYLRHQINKPFHSIMSEASVGKAYNEKLGIPPFRLSHNEVKPFLYNLANQCFYGARSEVNIRLSPAKILYCDFKSQYPLVNALLNSQEYLLADYLKINHCTEEAQELIDSITLEELQDKSTWKKLSMIVKIEADNAILPCRLEINSYTKIYGQMTVSPDTSLLVGWYSMLDVIASKIRTGISPIILDAYKLSPIGNINTNEIDVLGNKNYHVDLTHDDFFIKVIDLRDSVKNELKQIKKQLAVQKTEELYHQKNFLDNLQLALKLMANSTSYGILVETREIERQDIAAKYNAQPIGIHITAGARLLLNIAEKLGKDRNIIHAFCDTDSFAYAQPDTMDNETFHKNVMECIQWYDKLSPYASDSNIFELEEYNYLNGELTDLYALCISAKRYVLYNKLANGKYLIRKMSEHGIPYLLTNNEIELPNDVTDIERDETGVRKFKADRYLMWYRAIEQVENGKELSIPSEVWSMQLALTQVTISTPKQWSYFSYIPDVRPFSFFVTTPKSKDKKNKDVYYMPYVKHAGELNSMLEKGLVRKTKTNQIVRSINIDTIKDRLDDFFQHTENKSSNGDTKGVMQRRSIGDSSIEQRLRSGKKLDASTQLEMEW